MQRCSILLGMLLLTTTLSRAGDITAKQWSRFRGPNGTGVVTGQGIPTTWSDTNNVLWKKALPGLGQSSPVVWGPYIFIQSASEDGKQRWLLCLRAKTGDVLWQKTVAGTVARTHKKNSLASSTPATDGQRVYAIFWDGKEIGVWAYNLEGKELWQRPLGGFVSQHGPGLSPMVFEDRVYIANDQDGVANLFCLDAKDGNVLWKVPRKSFRACYSTPYVRETAAGPELVVASTAGITGYDTKTGKEYWNWNWIFAKDPLRTVASPIGNNDYVFINSGDGGGDRHTVAVKVDGDGPGTKASLAWESKRGFGYVPGMILHGDHLYFVNDLGIAACHVAKTGENVWTERLGGNCSSSLILVDGNIHTTNEDGTTYVFKASPKFELVSKNSIGEGVLSTPAVAHGRMYLRGQQHLYCIGTKLAESAPGKSE